MFSSELSASIFEEYCNSSFHGVKSLCYELAWDEETFLSVVPLLLYYPLLESNWKDFDSLELKLKLMGSNFFIEFELYKQCPIESNYFSELLILLSAELPSFEDNIHFLDEFEEYLQTLEELWSVNSLFQDGVKF